MRKAQDFNNIASDKRWVNLMGAIKGASQDLKVLAPHPDRPAHKAAPLSAKTHMAKAVANDTEGSVMVNLILGAVMGTHFGAELTQALHVPQWAQQVNWGNMVDAYDYYQADRHHESDMGSGEGNRGIELGKNGTLSGGFNTTSMHRLGMKTRETAEWDAYMSDLPQRRLLEQNIGGMYREAEKLEKAYLRHQKRMAYGM